MARRRVVEVNCDRCKRVEYQKEGSPQISFELTMEHSQGGVQPMRHIHFEDLCERCTQILMNYADKMDIVARNSGAKDEEESEKEELEEESPPSSTVDIMVD